MANKSWLRANEINTEKRGIVMCKEDMYYNACILYTPIADSNISII